MKSVIFGGDNTAPSTTVVNYNFLHASFISTWNATEINRHGVIPLAVDLSNLYIECGTAPGAGKSYELAVMKNGVATLLKATISDTNTTANLTGTTVSFAVGDTISIRCTPTGTPAASANMYWTMECESNVASFPIMGGTNTVPTGTQYKHLHSGVGAWFANDTDVRQVIPIAGTLKNLRVRVNVAPGGGTDSWTVTLMKNGVATALEVVLLDTETEDVDSVNTVAIAAGDEVSLQVVEGGIAIDSDTFSWGVVMDPTTNGESFFSYAAVADAANNNFQQVIASGNTSWNSTESARLLIFSGATIQGMYVELGTAPGAGTTRTFKLRSEGADQMTVTISNGETTGNASGSVAWTPGANIVFGHTETGTTAAMGRCTIGVKVFYESAATPTETFTVDGIVKEILTKTFTVDGIVKAQTTNTFTIDGIVKAVQSNTFTVDGIIKAQTTNTFTVDGIVLAQSIQTFTVDGIILTQVNQTFTIDGIVLAATTLSFTVDGIIFATATQTFTVDGIVKEILTKTFTVDAIVKAIQTQTFTVDGIVLAQTTNTFDIDGIVKHGGRQFSSGFEIPDIGGSQYEGFQSSGTVSISSAIKRSGNYSLRVNPTAAQGYFSSNFRASASDVPFQKVRDEISFRFYLHIATIPDANVTIFTVIELGSDEIGFKLNTDRTITLRNYDDAVDIGTSSPIPLSVEWAKIELRVKMHGPTFDGLDPDVTARLNDVEFASAQNVQISGNGFTGFELGITNDGPAATGDLYFDDIAVNADGAGYQSSYPGDGAIVFLRPNGAGDNTGWTGTFADIDEETPDDATSVVEANTAGQIIDVNIEAPPAAIPDDAIIKVIHVGVRFRADGADEPTFVTRLKASSGGVVQESNPITPTHTSFLTNWPTEGLDIYYLTSYFNPDTGLPWTKNDLLTTQIGARITETNTHNVEITAMWLVVEYVPAKTFTIDGEVITGTIKTFTVDGIVKAETSNTFTIDGIVLAQTTKTFTLDGIVLATTTNTFTIDGIVKTQTTNTFTVDGIVLAQTTNTFTVDGIVKEIFTKTFTIDGIVKSQTTNTFTIDGIVLATQTNTFTIDGIILAQTTNTFTIDGIVLFQNTATFTVDGIILITTTQTFTIDGIVLAQTLNTFTIDGIVLFQNTNTFTIDGIVLVIIANTFTIDGILLATQSNTFTVDGVIKEIFANTFTIDGIVLAQTIATFTIDGIVIAIITNTFTIDGIIITQNTAVFTVDGTIAAINTLSFGTDAIVASITRGSLGTVRDESRFRPPLYDPEDSVILYSEIANKWGL